MKSIKTLNTFVMLAALTLTLGTGSAWAAEGDILTVTVSPKTATVVVGATTTITAVVMEEDDEGDEVASQQTPTWTTSDATIATVAGGIVTGVKAGSATITATAGAKSDQATITVNAAPTDPPVTPPTNVVANITITKHPASQEVEPGDEAAELEVEAEEANGLELSYQWFKSPTSSVTAGVAIDDANDATYTPDDNIPGSYFYYVKVSAGSGNFKRTVTSNVAKIRLLTGEGAKIDDAVDGLWDLIKGTNASQTRVVSNLDLKTVFPTTPATPKAGVKVAWVNVATGNSGVVTAPANVIALGTGTTTTATVLRPDFDFSGDNGNGKIVLKATLTDDITDPADPKTYDHTLILLVPRKLDISSNIVFRDTTLVYNGNRQRIPSATIGSAIGVASFTYTYHTGATANDDNLVAGPYNGQLTANALTFTHPSTGTPAPGVDRVDEYWVKIRVNSTVANTANPSGGEKIAKLTIKGKLLSASTAKVLGTYTYSGANLPVNLEVKDGTLTLAPGTHYTVETTIKNAGTDSVKVTGVRGSNYSNLDTIKVPITVARKLVTVVVDENDATARTYDASDTLDRENLLTALDGLIAGEIDENKPTVTIKRAVYTPNGNATVNTATKASASNGAASITIALDWGDGTTKNYAFAGGVDTTVVRLTGLLISKRTLEASDVEINIPEDHLYTGVARPIPVAFSSDVPYREPATGGGRLTVLYDYSDSVSSVVPVKAGTYGVKVAVIGGVNFTAEQIDLTANYVIGEQKRPTLDPAKGDTTARGDFYHSQIVRLGVAQEFTGDDDGIVRRGSTLSYQWYRNDTLITGATDSLYRFTVDTTKLRPNPVTGTRNLAYNYKVRIVTKYPGQADAVDTSGILAVKVLSGQATSIADATVRVSGSWTYDGSAQEPSGSEVSVTFGGTQLTEGTDYELEYTENVNAGTAIVQIIGAGEYGDLTERAFSIAKRDLDPLTDLQVRLSGRYNAAAHPIDSVITLAKTEEGVTRTGLGKVSEAFYVVLDDDGEPTADTLKTSAPVDAGDYDVWVKFAAGSNFNAYDEESYNVGVYSIIPRTAVLADFTGYSLPPAAVVYDGQPHGVTGTIALPGTGYGKLVVRYNSDTTAPKDSGTYLITVQVEGGKNYFATSRITLGTVRIATEVSVASNDRVVPGKSDESAVVAPVAVVAGEFSVGPNPVAKASGKVGFFWNGSALKSGTLYVYDASGSLVTKVAVASKGAKEIGSWNLVDAKGRPVAEGTYLVKGALVTKAGSKVKVSSIIGVAK